MATFIAFLWFIRATKSSFFHLYLWQLKEYHIGRFLDHFRTAKGRKILVNKLLIIKLVLAGLFFLEVNIFLFILIIVYVLEVLVALKRLFQKRLSKPRLTAKTFVLILGTLLIELVFVFVMFPPAFDMYWLAFFLLAFDILTPLIITIWVLLLEVPTVFFREYYVKKAADKRKSFEGLKVVGITGSYGKTSTKEILYDILSPRYKVLKTIRHANSEMGVSSTVLKELNAGHEIFVAEMGAYGKGKIKLLADIAQPQIGVLTGINEQHMALYGSQEKIIQTKYELIQSLPKNGIAIFNGDNPYCLALYKKTKKSKRLYSVVGPKIKGEFKADIWAQNIKQSQNNLSFRMCSKRKCASVTCRLVGVYNVSNILGAACAAIELGMDLEEVAAACRDLKPLERTMKLQKGIRGFNIIDDSYSANPNGVMAALDYLQNYKGKKIIIMPCLIELGSSAKEIHKKIGKRIGQVCDLAIITTKEHFEAIKETAHQGGLRRTNILFIENTPAILSKVKSFAKAGDVILLESRVPDGLMEGLIG